MSVATPAEMEEAQISDVAFFFNCFLRPFATPETFQTAIEGWAKGTAAIADYHKDDGKFLLTHLHRAILPDSHYELINFGALADFSGLPFLSVTDFKEFAKIMSLGKAQKPTNFRNHPGGYKEIKGLTRTPEKPSLPKRRPDGSVFIIADFHFKSDLAPPPAGSPPGPPGMRPAASDAITQAITEFEADWIHVSGAHLLRRRAAFSEIYLYRRETHGLAAFVMRAECCDATVAEDAAMELRNFLGESEFLRRRKMSSNLDVYKVVVNSNGKELEENEFGIV